jgi:hypothetical protein
MYAFVALARAQLVPIPNRSGFSLIHVTCAKFQDACETAVPMARAVPCCVDWQIVLTFRVSSFLLSWLSVYCSRWSHLASTEISRLTSICVHPIAQYTGVWLCSIAYWEIGLFLYKCPSSWPILCFAAACLVLTSCLLSPFVFMCAYLCAKWHIVHCDCTISTH